MAGEITDTTARAGVGPITIDCEMARRHGWTEEQIQRAHDTIAAVSRRENAEAVRRYPERYRVVEGERVFIGDSE